MSTKREKMIDLMMVKRLAPSTQKSYLYSLECFAKYYETAPEQLTQDDLQRYIIHLATDKHLSSNSCQLHLQGIRFFYLQVLKRTPCDIHVLAPNRERRIPELLTRREALDIVNFPKNVKHKTQLQLCYSCGLRISEVLALRVKNIDGENRLLKVEQGKGKKDRLVPMPEAMLHQLRCCWSVYHPEDIFFYSSPHLDRQVHPSSVTKVLKKTKQSLGITKHGGCHSLRHAYATHQLEAGLPLHLLQRWLGHTDIRTTMRYIHWVPSYQNGQSRLIDLLGAGHG